MKIFLSAVFFFFLVCGCKNKNSERITESGFFIFPFSEKILEKQLELTPPSQILSVNENAQSKLIKLKTEVLKSVNIKIDSVHYSFISDERTLTGIFKPNRNKPKRVNALVNGCLEKMYHKATGEKINVGDALYDISSRDLIVAEEEYIFVCAKKEAPTYLQQKSIDAAGNKLIVLGLNNEQIKQLQTSHTAKHNCTIYSRTSGVVQEILSKEGDSVNEGATIYKIADLSSVWLEVPLLSGEIIFSEEGSKVTISSEVYSGEKTKGIVLKDYSENKEKGVSNLLRIEIDNSKMLYKPGMKAYVDLCGEEKRAIVMPSDAVLQSPKRNIVWLEKAIGVFEPRFVTLGIKNKRRVEIISGLEEGDKVVVSGTYLLNAEFVNKSKNELLLANKTIEKLSGKGNETNLTIKNKEVIAFPLPIQPLAKQIVENKAEVSLPFEESFRIQFKMSSKKLTLNNSVFKEMKGVREYEMNGAYKYTSGDFNDLEAAKEMLKKIKEKGFKDAFVVRFKDGKRI